MRLIVLVIAALSFGAARADELVAAASAPQQEDYLIAKQGKADVWAIDVDAHFNPLADEFLAPEDKKKI